MTATVRISTTALLMTALLAFAGGAAAQGHVGGVVDAATDKGRAAGEIGAYDDGNYADVDAAAATDEASGTLDGDASVAEVGDDGIWGWLSLRFGAFVARLNDLLATLDAGVSAPATDGSIDAYVSPEGVDLDANVAGLDFDGSAAGGLDDATWQTMARVDDAHANVGTTVDGAADTDAAGASVHGGLALVTG